MSILTLPKKDKFELIDLAQKLMDGFKDGQSSTKKTTGGNRVAEMMGGLPDDQCALLWALIRSTRNNDRYFGLVQLCLTNAIRQLFVEKQVKFAKLNAKDVAKGIARSVLTQYLFNKGMCRICCGDGKHTTPHFPYFRDCHFCAGTGTANYTGVERHRLTGLDIARQVYLRTYGEFEQAAFDILHAWRLGLDIHLRGYFYHAAIEYDL
ncbi:hypothetical protein [Aquirhabdus parva]|uniref:Uncharacterized protein n=1 Tax=Aquirhabdus parva TaxID=2283318 RepID=A0A345PAQ3_9GAMM|nr:hypothetical protein [Aquirhabdus parva]AXI04362.1 hypothetical protein HYN46_16880 [Aquirhabdus parva]AXI04406.1 hypothetical protein HYN46_17125 [Aquirhabdus parva]